jgi:hypothetical protein
MYYSVEIDKHFAVFNLGLTFCQFETIIDRLRTVNSCLFLIVDFSIMWQLSIAKTIFLRSFDKHR